MKNPNAFVAWITGLAATGLLWVAAKAGWHLSTATSALVAGAIVTNAAATVLWIGKHGIRGALQRAWGGVTVMWAGKPAP